MDPKQYNKFFNLGDCGILSFVRMRFLFLSINCANRKTSFNCYQYTYIGTLFAHVHT